MGNYKTNQLIQKANSLQTELKEIQFLDDGLENRIMTNEFVDNIKKDAAKNMKEIQENCNELRETYLSNAKWYAKIGKMFKF